MSHEGNDANTDRERDELHKAAQRIIVTPPPPPMTREERDQYEKEEREKAIREKGHYCEDYVCHGMYDRGNGAMNDYYYCGKCHETLQTG